MYNIYIYVFIYIYMYIYIYVYIYICMYAWLDVYMDRANCGDGISALGCGKRWECHWWPTINLITWLVLVMSALYCVNSYNFINHHIPIISPWYFHHMLGWKTYCSCFKNFNLHHKWLLQLHHKTKQHTKMLVNPQFCGLIPQFCWFSIKTTPTSHVKDFQPAVLASLGRGCSHGRKGLGNGASATWDMVNFTTLGW